MSGKCPKDGRCNRPVFILINNKQIMAIADGNGDCYMRQNVDFYEQLNTKCIEENKVNPEIYEFERGLTGFDF